MRSGSDTAGDGSAAAGSSSHTLGEAMRAPSANAPDVVVLDSMHGVGEKKETLNLGEDLWLSSDDGRFTSPIIPLCVGEPPHSETFYVHKSILLRGEYFRKALCGEFRESEAQAIDLPEEDPSIFHFIVAFLYEGRYEPIRPIASALEQDVDKGKGKDVGTANDNAGSGSSSDSSSTASSDDSARSRRQRQRIQRREGRYQELLREKHPGRHRPECRCPQCLAQTGPPCWHCGAPRTIVPPRVAIPGDPRAVGRRPGHHHPAPDFMNNPFHPPPQNQRHRRRRNPDGTNNPRHRHNNNGNDEANSDSDSETHDDDDNLRIRGEEDLRTWLLAYELNLDVYVCANKFLLDDFKHAIAREVINMLETAGTDAAQPQVLQLCAKLYAGLSESDGLLRMIFARIGFLQPIMWRRFADETAEFLHGNPEIGALILRETASRREYDYGGRMLPAMERGYFMTPPDAFRVRPAEGPSRWQL